MPLQEVAGKRCGICRVVKPLGDFHLDKRGGKGRAHRCKPCAKVYGRDRHIQLTYGLTAAEYDNLAAGGCHICGLECGSGNKLAVDHDHATGKIRGALCGKCNRGIGLLGDDPFLLRCALAYLEAHRG